MRGRHLNCEKWLSKAIIEINWFDGGVQTGIIVVKHTNECKCMTQASYYMHRKAPEHDLKNELGNFKLV